MNTNQERQYQVHEILNKHGFYRLHMHRLAEILHLLEAEEAREARYIQENAIKGLLKMAQKHKSKIKKHFQAKKFSEISQDTKRYVNSIVEDVIDATKKKQALPQEKQPPPNYNFPLLNYSNYPTMGYGAGEEISKMRIEQEQLKLRQMQMYYYGMFNPTVPNSSQIMGNAMGMPFGNVALQDNDHGPKFPIKYNHNSFASSFKNQDQILPFPEQKLTKIEGNLSADFLSLKHQQPASHIRRQANSQVFQYHKSHKMEPNSHIAKQENLATTNKIIKTRSTEVQTDTILMQKDFDIIKKPKPSLQLPLEDQEIDRARGPKRKIIKKEKEDKKDKKDGKQKNQNNEKMPEDKKEKLQKVEKQDKREKAQRADKIEKNEKQEKQNKLDASKKNQKFEKNQKQEKLDKPEDSQKKEKLQKDEKDIRPIKSKPQKIKSVKLGIQQKSSKLKQKMVSEEDEFKFTERKKVNKKTKAISSVLPELNPIKQIIQQQLQPLQENSLQTHVVNKEVNNIAEKKIQKEVITIPDNPSDQIVNNKNSNEKVSISANNNSEIKLKLSIIQKDRIENEKHQQEKNIVVVMNQEDLIDNEEEEFMNYKNGRKIAQPFRYKSNYLENSIANREQIDKKIKKIKNLTHCACKGNFDSNQLFECLICGKQYHNKCLQEPITAKYIECPSCKLQSLDPLNEVKEVIGQYYVRDINRKEFSISIDVNHYEYYCSQKIRKNEIQMRCYRISNNFDSSQITFPDQCIVRVNESKILQIPGLSMTSSLRKRKDYPIVLTSFLFGRFDNEDSYSLHQPVHLSLQIKRLTAEELHNKRVNNQYTYLIGIYYIQKLKTEDLYDKIIQKIEPFSDDYINSLMETNENDIEIDRVVCTLEDPFSRKLMDMPVRGLKCAHGQCFDLKTFIAFMSTFKNRCWRCPVCSKDSRSFKIDKQQLQLIRRSTQTEQIPSKITFQKDGKIFLKMNKEVEQNEKEEIENKKKIRRLRKKKNEKQLQQLEHLNEIQSEKLQKIAPIDNKTIIKIDKMQEEAIPYFKESQSRNEL